MKKFQFILVLLISVIANSQIVNIPDANFKFALVNDSCSVIDINGNCVGDADTNNDGEIQVTEAEAVAGLRVVNDIASLEGIQSFTSLRVLWCFNNVLNSIDLAQNNLLTELICSGNQLTSLNLSQNIDLSYVDCSENQISSIDVTALSDLQLLWMRNNNLTSINVSQNLELWGLGLPGNQLISIDVSQNSILGRLTVWNNQLSELDITQNPQITDLDISNNDISQIDITQNAALINFIAFGNELTSLDLSQNPNLVGIECYNNQITSLDFSQNHSLQIMRAYGNQLTSLNIQNGNNASMNIMLAFDNPNLECIQVDDMNATRPACDGNWFGWCKDASTIYHINCETLGTSEYDSFDAVVYPNPVQDLLNIGIETPIVFVKVYSLTGLLVLESLTPTINVSQLSDGMYFAEITSEGRKVVKRFIKE